MMNADLIQGALDLERAQGVARLSVEGFKRCFAPVRRGDGYAVVAGVADVPNSIGDEDYPAVTGGTA
jgi:hypothetical protein